MTTSPRPKMGDIYHTGIVVDDVEATMAELSAALGVTWRAVINGTSDMWTPEGTSTLNYQAVYSVQGPPHIELVKTKRNTIWDVPSPGFAHHVGLWSDDIERDAAELEAAGMTRAVAISRDGVLIATYHRARHGSYVELVDSARKATYAPPTQ